MGRTDPRAPRWLIRHPVLREAMRLDRPVLQVALDFENLPRAIQAAREAVQGGADWIEAGTPLIKSEGLDAVRELKRAFRRRKLLQA